MIYLRPVQNTLYFYVVVLVTLMMSGCWYSFTGASVPPHWKSISIPIFEDDSNYGQPSLPEDLTNALITKVQRDNTLQLADGKAASVELTARITAVIADKPIAVEQGAQATQMQVDITVEATLFDNVKNKQVWKKSLSAFGTYAAGALSEREAGLTEAVDKLTDDLLLEIISAW
jgi:Lipopolysaccharide-assembly